MKSTATKITLKKVEGKAKKATVENTDTHAMWQEANSTLTAWSHDSADMKIYPPDDPCCGCYDKTEFIITWSDSTEYHGRYDLQAQEHANIGRSIMRFFKYFLKNGTDRERQETLDYIENYEIIE